MVAPVAQLIDELAALSKGDLGDRWAKLTGRPVPRLSAAMLRLALGYELQARSDRKLVRRVGRELDLQTAGMRPTRSLRPGMRLAREHGGTVHVVTIGEQGEIYWNEREWNSLSEVARAITGTRWSGPAFFGLREKRGAA